MVEINNIIKCDKISFYKYDDIKLSSNEHYPHIHDIVIVDDISNDVFLNYYINFKEIQIYCDNITTNNNLVSDIELSNEYSGNILIIKSKLIYSQYLFSFLRKNKLKKLLDI